MWSDRRSYGIWRVGGWSDAASPGPGGGWSDRTGLRPQVATRAKAPGPGTCLMRQVAMHAHAPRKNRQNVCSTEGQYVILRIYGFRAGSAHREGGCNADPEINKLPRTGPARHLNQPARHTRRRQAQFIGCLRPWDGYPAVPSPPRLPPDGASTSLPVYHLRERCLRWREGEAHPAS